MHHEATACHVTGEIVDLLNLLTGILQSFRPKDIPHGSQAFLPNEMQISRVIVNCKDWPEVLRKLGTFLNTYNSGDLRGAALGVIFLKISWLMCRLVCYG